MRYQLNETIESLKPVIGSRSTINLSLKKFSNIVNECTEPSRSDHEASDKPTLFLGNFSQIALWQHEILGQLSDGAWENTRPDDHWEFWHDCEVKQGQVHLELGSSGRRPKKNGYNLITPLIDVIGDRMIKIGRLGKALGTFLSEQQGHAAEYIPTEKTTLEQAISTAPYDFAKKYLSSLS